MYIYIKQVTINKIKIILTQIQVYFNTNKYYN